VKMESDNSQNTGLERKRLSRMIAVCLIFLLCGSAIGYVLCYHEFTGEYFPWLKPEALPMPPELTPSNQTSEQVIRFIKNESTDKLAFQEGFNCVDYALMVCRNAHWGNITAYAVILRYEEPPHHMLVVMPTIDKGSLFFEPQSDRQVDPRVGKLYAGRKVIGIYVMVPEATFIPVDDSPEWKQDAELN